MRRLGLADPLALLLAWAPLHLLVAATGALGSPALPLAAAWVVALGLAWRRSAPVAAVAAAGLLIAGAALLAPAPAAAEVVRTLLLLALAGAAPHFLARSPQTAEPADPATVTRPSAGDDHDAARADAARDTLDLVRLAARADDAVLWQLEPASGAVRPIAWSGAAGWSAPEAVRSDAEHPYGWVLAKRQPLHLYRGRSALPREPAVEMLLVPLGAEPRLLTLGFAGPVPQDSEAAAFACASTLARLVGFLPDDAGSGATRRDALTDLPNREAFTARLATACALFQRYARPFSVVRLDIDGFKQVNDQLGFDAGDRALQHVAGLLRAAVREADLPARLDGEDFALLLPETSLDQALAVAERARRAVQAEPPVWDGRQLSLTVSVGVAACPETCALATDTLHAAEAALSAARRAGRNRVAPPP